jgi:hypothetical protein
MKKPVSLLAVMHDGYIEILMKYDIRSKYQSAMYDTKTNISANNMKANLKM